MTLAGVDAAPVRLEPALEVAFGRFLEERFGLRLSAHLSQKLNTAVNSVARANGCGTASELYSRLEVATEPVLAQQLVAQVTIGETHFFRVAPQIEALRSLILPDLIRSRGAARHLAIWSAGCSTGEEPYTMAILLREQAASTGGWKIDILGTDVSQPSLEVADTAQYGEWSFRDTPEAERDRWFIKQGKTWLLSESVRGMVRFARHNLAMDPTPSSLTGTHFDLILCRNVTIYFSPAAAQNAYRRLAAALTPGGWLILGPSDPPPERSIPLTAVYLHSAILWQKQDGNTALHTPVDTFDAGAAPAEKQPLRVPTATLVAFQSNRLAGPELAPPRPSLASAATPPVRSTQIVDHPSALAHADARTRAAAQPLDLDARNSLGMLSLDAGYFEDAINALRGVVFLDSSYVLAHFGLGRAYAHLGEVRRAQTALLQARRLLTEADESPVRGAEGLRVGDLRVAIEAQLKALDGDIVPSTKE